MILTPAGCCGETKVVVNRDGILICAVTSSCVPCDTAPGDTMGTCDTAPGNTMGTCDTAGDTMSTCDTAPDDTEYL